MVQRAYVVFAVLLVASLVAGFAAGAMMHRGGGTVTVTKTLYSTVTLTTSSQPTATTSPSTTSTATAWHAATGAAGFSAVPEEYREAYRLASQLSRMLNELPPELQAAIKPELTGLPFIAPVLPAGWVTVTAATQPIALPLSSEVVKAPSTPRYIVSTNVQVAGIDEPDIVKTNGTHIFIMRRNGIIEVVKAVPPEDMKVAAVINATATLYRLVGPAKLLLETANKTITLAKAQPRIIPRGLLVDGHGDVVALYDVYFEASYTLRRWVHTPSSPIAALLLRPTTWITVYSPSGRLKHWAWVNGWLVDARLDGDKLVVATRFTREFWWTSPLLPAPGWTSWGRIPLQATAVLGIPAATTTIVSVFNTVNWTRYAVSVTGPAPRLIYMTRSGDVYLLLSPATMHILHVLRSMIDVIGKTPIEKLPEAIRSVVSKVRRIAPWSTLVVRISTRGWKPTITAKRVVDGVPTTQFAIDVYRGYLRLALQRGWGNGFNLYVLNATSLNQVANMTVPLRLERVHAVRFVGDKLYIVTYRTVDPLFVIDLSNPKHPRILGYREGPGFDEYIHPLNETAFIGLGVSGGRRLRVSTYIIRADGSVERVSSVTLPDRYSIVFLRHGYHAFILDKRHHMVMFPGAVRHVTVTVNGAKRVITLGNFYVVPYDPSSLKLGEPRVLSGGAIRGVVVDDTLYTVSAERVAAYSLPGLKPLGEVNLQ